MMSRYLPIFILSAFLLLGVRLSLAEEKAMSGIKIVHDVTFLDPGRAEKLDLYLPKGDSGTNLRPAVVFIHGGAFKKGDKGRKTSVSICSRLAGEGFVVANANYALAKDGPTWPLPLLDCKNAVRFLRANAKKYNVDPDRISVMGTSAGANLALLVAFTTGIEKFEPASPWPGVSDAVSSVVEFYGGANFATRKKTDKDGNPLDEPYYVSATTLMGPSDNPRFWDEASPINYVKAGLLPVFITHGKRDTTVDYLQAIELADALNKAGVPNKLVMLEQAPHGYTFEHGKTGPLEMDLLPSVVAFLREAPAINPAPKATPQP